MMKLNLIAATYENIWPFKNKKLSLFFREWNYLIKAPIGTGKSFLFFDWPTYWLYKSSSRNILNIQSKTWAVKLLFSVDWVYYFVVRNLKQGKSRDSTSSHLYTFWVDPVNFLDNIPDKSLLQKDIDIEFELKKQNLLLQEVTMKNEADLQQHLNMLLPPQEVFVSTIFLLQDSQNIFEMQPSERLEVLKNVFWLLSIDESKEIVKDKRTEVRYQIKAYQDTSAYEDKLQRYLDQILHYLTSLENNEISKQFLWGVVSQKEELEIFKEKLSINNFSFPEELSSFVPLVEGKVKEIQTFYQEKKARLQAYQEQQKGLQNEIQKVLKEMEEKVIEEKSIKDKLASIKPEVLEQLKQTKKSFQDKQSKLEEQAETVPCKSFYDKYHEELSLQERSVFSLRFNYQFVQELMQIWTMLKSKIEVGEKEINYLKQKSVSEEENLKVKLKSLQDKKAFYDQQLQLVQERLVNFTKQIDDEAVFDCEQIHWTCPFVRLINKQHFDEREKEKAKFQKEKEELEAKVLDEKLDEEIQKIQNILKNPQDIQKEIQPLLDKNKRYQFQIETLRAFFGVVDHKKLWELFKEYEQLEEELRKIEKQIVDQEELQEQQEKYQQALIQIVASIEGYEKQKISLEEQVSSLQEKVTWLESEISQEPKDQISEVSQTLASYVQVINSLRTAITEYSDLQVKMKWLLEDEKMLNNLYTILNKDLLLFVLGEYLPVLTDIINGYLSSVVDYHISIKLKEVSEKLELETKVIDEKWEREIKSLSWWQKTILKLVWMLAISSYMNTEMLFLDETVNNLDVETVWKVAQMLDDFVKQREMKFYTITHNSEIQSMKIWNSTIEIV